MFRLDLYHSTTRRADLPIPRHPLDRRRRHCVYLAAPLPAYEFPAYADALSYLRSLYPEPRHTVLSVRELFASTADWKQRYLEVLEPVTAFYLLLHQGCAGDGCWAEWRELVARGVPALCFSSARTVVPIGSFARSDDPNPSLAWSVLDSWGQRIVPYHVTDMQLGRIMARFAEQERRRDWWLRHGAPRRHMEGGR
jgi:hypothetical protein